MLIHIITIKTFNIQKNCLTFETLFLFYQCNHKHKEIFFSINSIKKYSKKHNFSTAITYIQAKCNDFKGAFTAVYSTFVLERSLV